MTSLTSATGTLFCHVTETTPVSRSTVPATGWLPNPADTAPGVNVSVTTPLIGPGFAVKFQFPTSVTSGSGTVSIR